MGRFWLSHSLPLPVRAAKAASLTSEPQLPDDPTHTPARRSEGQGKEGKKGKEGGGGMWA
ncbi:MAG: hypothetical protein IJK48_03650 [Bacteroidales bacterium]|nr:hypothetical protein [Bacteroidales bacterium]